MIRLEQKFKQHPQVVATELDPNEAVLLHLDNQRYYTLNQTGWCIWKYLEENLTLRQIVQKLQEQYKVDPKNAERSVINLINDLNLDKLVEEAK